MKQQPYKNLIRRKILMDMIFVVVSMVSLIIVNFLIVSAINHFDLKNVKILDSCSMASIILTFDACITVIVLLTCIELMFDCYELWMKEYYDESNNDK